MNIKGNIQKDFLNVILVIITIVIIILVYKSIVGNL